MKREITIDKNGNKSSGKWGYVGEKNETHLIIELPDHLINCDYCQAEISANGKKTPSGSLNIVDGKVTVVIPLESTACSGKIHVQLIGYVVDETGEIFAIGKSDVFEGKICPSVSGEITSETTNPSLLQRIWAKIEALAKKMHEHKNKETLDNLSPETMKLLKDGAVVKSIDITTDENNIPIMRLELMRQYADYEKFYFFNLPLFAYEETYSGDGDEARLGVNLDIGLTNYKPMPQVEGEIGSAYGSYGNTFIYPNVHYDFGKVDILHILLNEGDLGYVNDYNFSFIADELTIFSLPYEVNWGNDNEIVIEGGKRYEVSIVNNVALWTSAAVEAVTE